MICWTPHVIYAAYASILKDKGEVPRLANPLVSNPFGVIYAKYQTTMKLTYLNIVYFLKLRIATFVELLVKAFFFRFFKYILHQKIYIYMYIIDQLVT